LVMWVAIARRIDLVTREIAQCALLRAYFAGLMNMSAPGSEP